MLARERRLKLQSTTGITCGDDVGIELRNEFRLAIAKGVGRVGLDEIVDSCGAAADGGFGNFGNFERGNACEQSARLRTDTLRMLQMAGIVKRHAQSQRMARAACLEFGENFADVLALCRSEEHTSELQSLRHLV